MGIAVFQYILITKRVQIGQWAIVYQFLAYRSKMGRFLSYISRNNERSGISGKWQNTESTHFLRYFNAARARSAIKLYMEY